MFTVISRSALRNDVNGSGGNEGIERLTIFARGDTLARKLGRVDKGRMLRQRYDTMLGKEQQKKLDRPAFMLELSGPLSYCSGSSPSFPDFATVSADRPALEL